RRSRRVRRRVCRVPHRTTALCLSGRGLRSQRVSRSASARGRPGKPVPPAHNQHQSLIELHRRRGILSHPARCACPPVVQRSSVVVLSIHEGIGHRAICTTAGCQLSTSTLPGRFSMSLVIALRNALLVTALVSCSSNTTGPVVQQPPGGGGSTGSVVDVSIRDFTFTPASVTVKMGSTVRWTNNGPSAHTTTSDMGVWDSGVLSPNAGTFEM